MNGRSVITSRVVQWAAQECAWQQSGEVSVWRMVDAWLYAHRRQLRPVTLRDVLTLGRLVEPQVNRAGIRKVGVRVGWDVKLEPERVPAALSALLEAQPSLGTIGSPVERWFREYEDVHPFRDGNGRTGSILLNWLRGSLPRPIYPPNLWHDPRRDFPDLPLSGPKG